ncbi:unnamed protein product [Rangifer tarandus platyrhynchus]|uniref:Uncharacterized protein n=1 Tax=Rangifer tarandus platyrhynchus TaxID=3082113 RepID=A0ABN8Y204_RANTA|nr:unnamed protein product [Rangifer tarandus platyrhynchus]
MGAAGAHGPAGRGGGWARPGAPGAEAPAESPGRPPHRGASERRVRGDPLALASPIPEEAQRPGRVRGGWSPPAPDRDWRRRGRAAGGGERGRAVHRASGVRLRAGEGGAAFGLVVRLVGRQRRAHG